MLILKKMMDGCKSQEGDDAISDPGEIPAGQTFVEPRGMDVLLGRGKRHIGHPGNRRYQAFIAANSGLYNETWSRNDKAQIIDAIISYVHQMGRFLKRGIEGWYEIPEKEAKEKCAQSLRNYRRPKGLASKATTRQLSPQGNRRSPGSCQRLSVDDDVDDESVDDDHPSPRNETSQNLNQRRPHRLLQSSSIGHVSDHLSPQPDTRRDSAAAAAQEEARPTVASRPNHPSNTGQSLSAQAHALAAAVSERVNQMKGLQPGLMASSLSAGRDASSFLAFAPVADHQRGSDNDPTPSPPEVPARPSSRLGSALTASLAETLRVSPIPLGPNVSFEPARTFPPSPGQQGNAARANYQDVEGSTSANYSDQSSHPVAGIGHTANQTSHGFLASSNVGCQQQPRPMDESGRATTTHRQVHNSSAPYHGPLGSPALNPQILSQHEQQRHGQIPAAVQPSDPRGHRSSERQRRGPDHRSAEDGGVDDGRQVVQPLPVRDAEGEAEVTDNDLISALGFFSQQQGGTSDRNGRHGQE